MRLLIIGTLDGHIAQAGQIALSRGALVAQVDDIREVSGDRMVSDETDDISLYCACQCDQQH